MAPRPARRFGVRRIRRLERFLWILVMGMAGTFVWISHYYYYVWEGSPSTCFPLCFPTTATFARSNNKYPNRNHVMDPWEGMAMAIYNNNNTSHNQPTGSVKNLPNWIKEYMKYHTEVVQNLTVHNWKEYKYLVLRCYRRDERCGGLSDRIKPVPLILLAAQRSQRILFIDWDRPFELQHFLVPPKHGFQWTVPRALLPLVRSTSTSSPSSKIGRAHV